MNGLKSGDLHQVLCALSQTCTATPDDPCLVLANVTVAADGTLTVDSCSPRTIAPTNRILMQLVSCFADCCGQIPPPPSLLEVTAVRVLTRHTPQGNLSPTDPALPVVGELAPPDHHIQLKPEPLPEVIEVEFASTADYDPASVIVADSLIVAGGKTTYKLFTTATTPTLPSNVFRLQHPKVGFQRGKKYAFTLVGDATASAGARTRSLQPTAHGSTVSSPRPARPAGTRVTVPKAATSPSNWRSSSERESRQTVPRLRA